MGANFVSFKATGTRQDILIAFEALQAKDRFENGHSYSGGIGMAAGLSFVSDEMFQDDKAADKWLADHCEKWEEAKAVPVMKGTEIDHYRIGAWCSC